MSILMLNQVMNLSRLQVTPNEKLVLLVLADKADENGHCWPGVLYLSTKSCLSPRTVLRLLKGFRNKGWLKRNRRRKGYRRTSNEYWLELPHSVTVSHSHSVTLSHSQGVTVSPNTSEGIHQSDTSESEASPSPLKSEEIMLGGNKQPLKGSKKQSATDVQSLLGHSEENPSHDTLIVQLMAKKATGAALARFWRRIIIMHQPEYGPIPELKQKEIGHLIQLKKYWGSEVGQIMVCAVKDWIEFTKYAEDSFGAFKSPMLPTLPYMVMYSQAGLSFHHQKHGQLQSIANETPKQHTIVKPKSNEEAQEQEKPMTLDEFNEIEEQFKGE